MSEFIKNKFGKTIIVLAVLDVVIILGLFYRPARIPEELKIKADKSKILSAQEVDWRVYDDFGKLVADKGRGVRYYYVSDAVVPPEPGEDIAKRTDNTKFFTNKTNGQIVEYTAKIYQGRPFYRDGDKWYQVESAITTLEAYREQTKVSWLDNFFGQPALATDLSPAPYAEAGDGYIEGYNTTFSASHDGTTGASANYTATAASLYVYRQNSAAWWIRRIALPFNTAAIPNAATISAATLYVYPTSNFTNNHNDAYSYVGLVHTFTASTSTLATSDYDDIGSNNDTAGTAMNASIQQTGSITLANLLGGAYRSIALDATGIAWISKTGYTKLGLREGHDLVEDGTGFTDGQFNGGAIYTSEQTSTTNDPYLAVTYTLDLYPFTGYIDELRVSSGTARWTADFSASLPTAEY